MAQRLYKDGLPFSKKLGENLDPIMARIDKKKASLLLIDGGLGEGKSTLAIECADYVARKLIDLKINYSMGGDQFQENLEICYNKAEVVVIYDEAGDFARRGALTTFNRRLVRIFETYRAFKIMVILALPNFAILDERLFELKIPRLLIHCYGRTENQGNFKCYSLYRMQYIKDRMKKLIIKEFSYGMVQPNFYGHFLDLSPERSRALDEISIKGKEKIVTANILESSGLINIVGLMRKLHRSRAWVSNKIRALKLKEARIYKKSKYYDGGVLDILREEMVRGSK